MEGNEVNSMYLMEDSQTLEDNNGESQDQIGEDNNENGVEQSAEEIQKSFDSLYSQNIYCGLLTRPDSDQWKNIPWPKIKRQKTTKSSEQYPIANFLQYKSTMTRSGRREENASANSTISISSGGRQSRTFNTRLEEFRPILEENIASSVDWNCLRVINKIVDISSMKEEGLDDVDITENSEDSLEKAPFSWDNSLGIGFRDWQHPIILIGYVSKSVEVEKAFLNRLCKNIGIIPLRPQRKSHQQRNCLFLEDSSAKIRLVLNKKSNAKLKYSGIVSGVPIAVKGVSSNGRFLVEDVIFATLPQPKFPLSYYFHPTGIPEIIFISGLNINKPYINWPGYDLLTDYLLGVSGSVVEQKHTFAKRTKVFFLGNSLYKPKKWIGALSEELVAENCEAAERLDVFFDNISKCMEVYVLPGENDTTHQTTLPQPAIHPQLLPLSFGNKSFKSLTNPAKVQLSVSKNPDYDDDTDEEESPPSSQEEKVTKKQHEISIILSSGKNVKETMQNCDIQCPLEMSAKLLEWSHLHPTSLDDTPLAHNILGLKESSLPHLFVVGGLRDWGVKEWNGTKIVCVPSFVATNTIMVLSKRRGEVLPLSFKVTM